MAKKGRKKVKKSQKKSPEEAKSEIVEILVAKCGKEKEEVLEAWDQFHEQFPGGLIPKEDFLASKKNRMLAESLFKVFDDDNSGTFSFEEYYQANNVGDLSSPESKLSWIFTAFDADGGGTIDAQEIRDIVVGLFHLAGIEEDEDLLYSCTEDVRATVDQDGDGDISKEEFVKNAMNSKFIHDMLVEKSQV